MIDDLISDYRDAAIMHGDGTMSGDSKKANQAFNRLQDVLNKLTEIGEDKALLELFSDENVWVQLLVAAHSLETDEHNIKLGFKAWQTQEFQSPAWTPVILYENGITDR